MKAKTETKSDTDNQSKQLIKGKGMRPKNRS